MGGEGQILKRIPRIKFPQRHPKSSASVSRSGFTLLMDFSGNGFMINASISNPKHIGSTSQAQHASTDRDTHNITISRSDVPAAPLNTAVGGQASLQPKRTPVSDKEIEAIMLGGCI